MPKKTRSADIPGFHKRPYPEQLAVIFGRVLGLGAAVDELEEILAGHHLELGERFVEAGVREPVTTLEEVVEIVLALEARVSAMNGALQFLGSAMGSLDGQIEALEDMAFARLDVGAA